MSASPAFSFPGRYKNGSKCLKRCVAGASASKCAIGALHGGALLLPVTALAKAKRGFLRPDEQFPQVPVTGEGRAAPAHGRELQAVPTSPTCRVAASRGRLTAARPDFRLRNSSTAGGRPLSQHQRMFLGSRNWVGAHLVRRAKRWDGPSTRCR